MNKRKTIREVMYREMGDQKGTLLSTNRKVHNLPVSGQDMVKFPRAKVPNTTNVTPENVKSRDNTSMLGEMLKIGRGLYKKN